MSRGGARKGAGRKAGAATVRTREIANHAVQTGTSPLEYMLAVMHGEIKYDEHRFEAAKAAAPFVHPRLVASKIEGKVEVTLDQLIAESYLRPPVKPEDELARH